MRTSAFSSFAHPGHLRDPLPHSLLCVTLQKSSQTLGCGRQQASKEFSGQSNWCHGPPRATPSSMVGHLMKARKEWHQPQDLVLHLSKCTMKSSDTRRWSFWPRFFTSMTTTTRTFVGKGETGRESSLKKLHLEDLTEWKFEKRETQ